MQKALTLVEIEEFINHIRRVGLNMQKALTFENQQLVEIEEFINHILKVWFRGSIYDFNKYINSQPDMPLNLYLDKNDIKEIDDELNQNGIISFSWYKNEAERVGDLEEELMSVNNLLDILQVENKDFRMKISQMETKIKEMKIDMKRQIENIKKESIVFSMID